MDLEKRFTAAVAVIQNLPKDGSFQTSNEMKLQFYAYYKQVTVGACSGARPGFWDLVNRAKYDAWHGLGDMDRNTAMKNYVENLNKIIETMNFSADVEQFMDALGPFYEEVDKEDEETAKESNHHQPNVIGLKTEHLSVIEEDPTTLMNDLIGSYDGSDSNMTDQTEDSDFLNGNSSELREDCISSRRGQSLSGLVDVNDDDHPNELFEELKLAKESLEEAKLMMNGDNIENEGKISRLEIERMLGNIDGFIPRPNEAVNTNGVTDDESELSANEDDEDLFEDSVETISVRSPPPAPLHARQEGLAVLSVQEEEEEEEVLVVTTDPGPDLSDDVTFQLQLTVERIKSDLQHLQARLGSVETIVTLKDNKKTDILDWWPFEDLAPKTVLFMVSWPIISHGLIQLAKVAFRKSRK